MKGAVSNQIVKCIVYSNSIERGNNQIKKIADEYEKEGIYVVRECASEKSGHRIDFTNGEEWIVVFPNDGARGYRWRKAYVDAKTVTLAQLNTRIIPSGNLYQLEDYKLFY